jgi:hypothetical protein
VAGGAIAKFSLAARSIAVGAGDAGREQRD